MGFKCADGSRCLECHHILALADEGANREAHSGERRDEMEAEMIAKVAAAELSRLGECVTV
ncbi:hypothetical protein BCCGELA001_30855 [Bradyrhizobium sp. CCGE-LA001]|nr:hypothetical protein BCCGELA001_30855 [Bradyrhizobium sp. CCGE-LA001]